MVSTKRSTIVMVCCVTLIGAGVVAAQNWPQWLGPNRDAKVTGFEAPAKWPAALTQKWKITVGAGDSAPALVGDRLYVFTRQGDDETLTCMNAADGKEIWQDKYAAEAISGPSARQHPGPRSSVTVADGKVVTLGVAGVLSCLDTSSKVLWRNDKYTGTPRFYTAMSPIIVDGMCIAHLGGSDNGAVVAFDLTSGDEKWKWTGEGPSYASPELMTVGGVTQVVVQTEKSLLGLAVADGKVLWQMATPPQGRFNNAATPIVAGQVVIYTGQGEGTKAVKIDKQGDGFATSDLWSNSDLGTQYNTPVLKNGLLFGLSNNGFLFCLNAETGQTAWTDTTKHQGFGSVIDAGSVMLALSSDSQLIVYKPDGKAFSEIASYKVAETPVYACPVVTGNRIYVKDQDSLTLWTVD